VIDLPRQFPLPDGGLALPPLDLVEDAVDPVDDLRRDGRVRLRQARRGVAALELSSAWDSASVSATAVEPLVGIEVLAR
jgi:hypothetical protein